MSAPKTEQSHVVNLTIDGIAVTVPKGTTVYHAARQIGREIPIFCYQDRMPPFGACRVCLVEVEKMAKPQTSCTLEAAEGMVVKTQSPLAIQSQEEIIELLLINHPLDCPICDRGGECPLQDQTFKYGPGRSQFFEEKRRFVKPWPLGPVLMLDRERCIICARCIRFGELIAGDQALQFIDRGYRTEVGTADGKTLDSKFIGNTIMICPVGALTSSVYRFRARPWDNDQTKSTCTLCPVGCSMILDSRDGEIMRTRSKENHQVNDIWLCDKGWFGYEFAYHADRLQTPLIRRHDHLEPASWDTALSLVADKMNASRANGRLAALGGNPLTVEENYLLQKLMREGLGTNHIDHRVGTPLFDLNQEGVTAGMEMMIGECEELSFAVLFGVDLTEEFPVIWLRLRQAINRGATVLFFGHFSPEIAPYLSKVTLHAPGTELEILKRYLPQIASMGENKQKGALFVGRQYLGTSHRYKILSELLAFQESHTSFTLNILEGNGNSIGARIAGMRPDMGPLNQPINYPGFNSAQILEESAKDGWDFLYVVGANPVTKFPSKLWNEARQKLKFLVVQDLFLTETARQADVVLPTLCFLEKEGSFINIDGHVQALIPGKQVPADLYSDADIFMKLATKLNFPLKLDLNFWDTLKTERRPFTRVKSLAPLSSLEEKTETEGVPGALLASFAPVLFDHGVRMKHDVHLIHLAKEPRARLNPHEAIKRGLQEGDRVRLQANDHSIHAKVKLDEQVSIGTIVLPLGFAQVPVHDLSTNLLNGLMIDLQKEV